jgi:glycosyltransferase involved in cell wall biosynthesis
MSRVPECSVVIPTRDRVGVLMDAALRSALGQRDVEHEVIVVDDASTDGTPDRLDALHDDRLSVVRLETRSGVAAARNAGIAAARGRWVAFLDDDDLWSPDKLRRQLDAARERDADVVYAGVVSVDRAGSARYRFPLPDPNELPRLLLASSALPAGGSNVVARTELVRRLGGFDEQLFQLADWDLWIRLAWAGRLAAAEEVLVGYVEHDDNMLLSDPRDVTPELEYVAAKHEALRRQHGVELDRRTFDHWVAWGHLRRRRRLKAARVFLRSGIRNRQPHDLWLAAAFAVRPLVPGARRTEPSTVPASAPGWLQLYR